MASSASRAPPARLAQPECAPPSERKRAVLRLLADGLSNREIAARLVLAERTVKNHVGAIPDKLQVANPTQAARVARAQGLIYPRFRAVSGEPIGSGASRPW